MKSKYTIDNFTEKDLERAVSLYTDMLYRICFVILKNEQDTQDVLQETFLQYLKKHPSFNSEEHRKAWLIKVSQNKCKDFLRFHRKHQYVALDEVEMFVGTTGKEGFDQEIEELWALSAKYKTVILLHYVEGYSVKEISTILKISEGAVKKRLERARKQLKNMLGDANNE